MVRTHTASTGMISGPQAGIRSVSIGLNVALLLLFEFLIHPKI